MSDYNSADNFVAPARRKKKTPSDDDSSGMEITFPEPAPTDHNREGNLNSKYVSFL